MLFEPDIKKVSSIIFTVRVSFDKTLLMELALEENIRFHGELFQCGAHLNFRNSSFKTIHGSHYVSK